MERESYSSAGVDIAAGDRLVERIGRLSSVDRIGGFAAIVDFPRHLRDPVLVTCCDGVGTKLRLLGATGRLRTAGIDLVAMCVNDLVCCGAEPACFLDYYGCGRLNEDEAAEVIESIAECCAGIGCRLAGGETAELPGLLAEGQFDLAGFAIGFAEREQLLGSERVQEDDALVALAATGPHSNGFSLIRRIIEAGGIDIESELFEGRPAAEALLAPTAIYVQAARRLRETGGLHALAHITGGGLAGNLLRVIPEQLTARIQRQHLSMPPLFAWLAAAGRIDEEEMRRVFNCGIGMVAVIAQAHLDVVLDALAELEIKSWPIGAIAGRRPEEEGIVLC